MSDARVGTARQLMDSWELDQAMALLKGALQEHPEDNEVRQALMEIQELQMLDMQLKERLRRARALSAEGQKEQALQVVAEVLKIGPQHKEALALQAELSAPADGWGLGAPSLEEMPIAPPGGDFGFGELPAAPATDFDFGAAPPAPSAPAAPASFSEFEMPAAPDAGFAFDAPPPSAPAAGGFTFEAPASEGFGFEPPPPMEATSLSAPPGSAASSLSSQEQAKVAQYIADGKALFAQGKAQDAIDLWTRVFILDEENTEAQVLIDQARASLNANQGELDFALNEGIAAFNAGDFGRAKPLLEKILQLSPGHREALYYLSRLPAEAAPPVGGEAAPDFELEGDFAAPAPTGFSAPEAPAPSPFGAPPASFSAPEPPPAPSFSPPPPPPPPAAAAPPPLFSTPAPSVPTPSSSPFGVQDDGAFEVEDAASEGFGPSEDLAPPAPPPPAPPTPPVSVAVPRMGGKPIPQKKSGPSLKLILGIAGGLILVGAGIFIVPKLLGGKTPPPPPPKTDTPPPKTATQPDLPPQPPQPPQPQTKDELVTAAKEAMAANQFQQSVEFYKKALNLDPLSPELQSGLESARAALLRQQEEEARNAKFMKDYQTSVKSYRDGDYGEALRLAWRLIYPDDTLAKQLGKANSVRLLLRNGYYNWAVRDLKSENPRGAEKNLKDLLDADRNDPEAKRLLEFAQKYIGRPIDAGYRDTVAALSYRPFEEVP